MFDDLAAHPQENRSLAKQGCPNHLLHSRRTSRPLIMRTSSTTCAKCNASSFEPEEYFVDKPSIGMASVGAGYRGQVCM